MEASGDDEKSSPAAAETGDLTDNITMQREYEPKD